MRNNLQDECKLLKETIKQLTDKFITGNHWHQEKAAKFIGDFREIFNKKGDSLVHDKKIERTGNIVKNIELSANDANKTLLSVSSCYSNSKADIYQETKKNDTSNNNGATNNNGAIKQLVILDTKPDIEKFKENGEYCNFICWAIRDGIEAVTEKELTWRCSGKKCGITYERYFNNVCRDCKHPLFTVSLKNNTEVQKQVFKNPGFQCYYYLIPRQTIEKNSKTLWPNKFWKKVPTGHNIVIEQVAITDKEREERRDSRKKEKLSAKKSNVFIKKNEPTLFMTESKKINIQNRMKEERNSMIETTLLPSESKKLSTENRILEDYRILEEKKSIIECTVSDKTPKSYLNSGSSITQKSNEIIVPKSTSDKYYNYMHENNMET